MIVSAGGIVFHKNSILLLKRSSGLWVLPKGRVEKGESSKEAAIREVKEETGIEAKIVGEAGTIYYSFYDNDNRYNKKVVWYTMNVIGGEPKPQKEEGFVDAKFISLRKINQRKMHFNEYSIIKDYL